MGFSPLRAPPPSPCQFHPLRPAEEGETSAGKRAALVCGGQKIRNSFSALFFFQRQNIFTICTLDARKGLGRFRI